MRGYKAGAEEELDMQWYSMLDHERSEAIYICGPDSCDLFCKAEKETCSLIASGVSRTSDGTREGF